MALSFREPWVALLLAAAAVIGAGVGAARREMARREGGGAFCPRWPAGAGRAVLVAVATATIVTSAAVALAPVHASGVAPGPPRIVDRPGPPPSTAQPPARLDVTVTALTDDPVRVALPTALVLARDRRLPGFSAAGWRVEPDDERVIESVRSGQQFSFVGVFDHVVLDFVQERGAGIVEVAVVGAPPLRIDLVTDSFGVRPVRIESGHTRVETTGQFAWRGHRLEFSQPVARLESATLGSIPTDSTAVVDGDGRVVGARIGLVAAVRALGRGYVELLGVVVVALLTALAAALVGAGLEPPGFAWGGRRRWIMRTTVGLAAAMAVLGALNYVLPVRLALVALVPLLGRGGYRALCGCEPATNDSLPRSGAAPAAVVSTAAILAATSFTYVISERWAIGHLQTDVFDTFNLTSLFWEHGALDASTDFGNGFRLLDYSARAAVWGPLLLRPSDAVIVLRLLTLALLVPLTAGLTAGLRAGPVVQVAVAVATASGGALVSLYAEGYMSREFFALWMLLGLAVIGHQFLDGRLDAASWFLVGVVGTIPLAIVPPYFLLGPGIVGAVLVATAGRDWRRRLRAWRRPALGLGAAALTLGLPNLYWLRRAGDAERYVAALNQLVRTQVVPFYGGLRFPGGLIGLVPMHNQSRHRIGASTYELGFLRWETDWLAGPALVIVAFVVVGLAVLAGAAWLATAAAGPPRITVGFVSAVFVAYLVGLAVLRLWKWDDQTYFTIMWAWTLAPIALTCVMLVLAVLSRHRSAGLVAASVAVALAAVNVAAAGSEAMLWTESPSGARAGRWHLDMAAPADRLADALGSGAASLPTHEFAIVVATPSALTGTDDDRVLTNVLVNLLEAAGYECARCTRNTDVAIVEPATAAPRDRSVLLIGDRNCGPRSVVFEDEYFAICGPVG